MKSSCSYFKPKAIVPVCRDCHDHISTPVATCVACARRRSDFSDTPFPKYYNRILGQFRDKGMRFSKTLCLLCADPNITLKQAALSEEQLDEPYSRSLSYLVHQFPSQVKDFETTSRRVAYRSFADCYRWDFTNIQQGLQQLERWDLTVGEMEKKFKEERKGLEPWEQRLRREEINKMFHNFHSGTCAFQHLIDTVQNQDTGLQYVASITLHQRTLRGYSMISTADACKRLYERVTPDFEKLKIMKGADCCKLCTTYCTTKESVKKHLEGQEHLSKANQILRTIEFWREHDEVDFPDLQYKGRIVEKKAYTWTGLMFKIATDNSRNVWVSFKDIEVPRFRIPSLQGFDGKKLRVDIAHGRFDYDLKSRLTLSTVRKWFKIAFDAHVVRIRIEGSQREVSMTCLEFGWPHCAINLVLQFAGFWNVDVYFDGTGMLHWEQGTSRVSKTGTFV